MLPVLIVLFHQCTQSNARWEHLPFFGHGKCFMIAAFDLLIIPPLQWTGPNEQSLSRLSVFFCLFWGPCSVPFGNVRHRLSAESQRRKTRVLSDNTRPLLGQGPKSSFVFVHVEDSVQSNTNAATWDTITTGLFPSTGGSR